MDRNRKAIFVVGNSRSGTTMLGRILGKSESIFTFRELHFFEQLCSSEDLGKIISSKKAVHLFAQLIALQRDGYLLVKHVSPSYIDEAKLALELTASITSLDVFAAFLEYETALHGKTVPCEQTPRNLQYVPEILKYYDDAKVVVMIRDPRDVLLSQKRKWKRKFLGMPQLPWHESIRTWINYSPITISLLWVSSIRASQMFADETRVKVVKYEALLKEPQQTLTDLCSFLGIKYHLDMMKISLQDSSNQSDEPEKEGIDSSRMGQWRAGGLNKAEIYICQKLTGRVMSEEGYRQESIKLGFGGIVLVAVYWVFFPVKASLAIIMNLHRAKDPVSSVRLRLGKLLKSGKK